LQGSQGEPGEAGLVGAAGAPGIRGANGPPGEGGSDGNDVSMHYINYLLSYWHENWLNIQDCELLDLNFFPLTSLNFSTETKHELAGE